jgi:hypothetical protein
MLARVLVDMLLACGDGFLEERHPGAAFKAFSLAARLNPGRADCPYAAARAAHALGESERAASYCERALDLDPAMPGPRELLSELFLRGENYFQVLARIHQHLAPRTYLEIGVETGYSMQFAAPGTRAIGVDPKPAITVPLGPNVRIFAETSDEFFARRDVRAELGGLALDLAFIDGMHHFDFALRDFMNIERLCAARSTVLIHDCFPRDRRTAQREPDPEFWPGDVWRLIVLLKKYRPDLQIHTVATPPTGLAIVRNLDPASGVIAARLPELCEEFLALDYRFLDGDRAGRLNLFPNDWDRVRELLPVSP